MKLLCVGLESKILNLVEPFTKNHEVRYISNYNDFEGLLSEDSPTIPSYILIGTQLDQVSANECIQTLRGLFMASRIVFLSASRKDYSRTDVLKNGCNESFLIPIDKQIFIEEIKEILTSEEPENLAPLSLDKLKPGESLPYNIFVFFEKNNKFVMYSKANEPLDANRLERLRKNNIKAIFVPERQLKLELSKNKSSMDSLEKKLNQIDYTDLIFSLADELRLIYHIMLQDKHAVDFTLGKEILQRLHKMIDIVKKYKTQLSISESIRLIQTLDSRSLYIHSLQTAFLAHQLTKIYPIDTSDDFILSGLIHDIGKQITFDDQGHCKESIALIKEKRIVITPKVQSLIELHEYKLNDKEVTSGEVRLSTDNQIFNIANDLESKIAFKGRPSSHNLQDILGKYKSERYFDLALLMNLETSLEETAA